MSEFKKEYTLDDLEDIIQEYSDNPKPKKDSPVGGDTVRLDTVKTAAPNDSAGDTKPLPDIDSDVKIFPGKGKPVQKRQEPIAFPQTPAQQIRQKMSGDPERRIHFLRRELSSMQAMLLLQGILLAAAAGTTLLFYQASVTRVLPLIAGQLVVMLLSALVGYRQMLGGVKQMLQGKFSFESMLVLTLAACMVDGVCCFSALRLPFGAVFCLQMLIAQWAQMMRYQTELSRLETLQGAEKVDAVVKMRRYYQGKCAYGVMPGQVDSFFEESAGNPEPERIMSLFCLCTVVLSLVLALACGLLYGFASAMQICAGALLAAMPASVFVFICRPEAVLEKRMHKLGLVLCGWKGLRHIERKSVYPLDHGDLFPDRQVKLNGVRFYGGREPNSVVSYVAALAIADGGCLAEPFEQLRSSRNARKMWVKELTSYPNGIGGQIDGMTVIVGTMEFMKNMRVEVPEGAGVPHAVYAAVNGSLCAVFAVSFTRSKSTVAGLRSLCQSSWVSPVLTDCDFVLTPGFLQQKMELDLHRMLFPNYYVRMELAEKKPEQGAPVIALATKDGLAQRALAVTGGAAVRSAWTVGMLVHLLGGSIGLLAVGILSLLGAGFLLTPYNLLLYGCMWMIPGLLVAEWTRNI